MSALNRLFGVLLAWAVSAVAASAHDFQIDEVRQGVLTTGGKQVPLPAGDWRVAGYRSTTLDTGMTDFGPYGVVHDVVLFRVSDGGLDAFVQVNTNALPVNDGWGVSKDCKREDLLGTSIRYQSGWDASCLFVSHVLSAGEGKPSPAWTAALAYAKERNLAVPKDWIMAGFRVSNRRDVVDARFAFNPERHGFAPAAAPSWAESPWHKARLSADLNRERYVRNVSEWAAGFAGLVEEGIKNRLADGDNFPMPVFTDRPAQDHKRLTAAARLHQLDLLFANRLVDEASYRSQRELILSGAADEPTPQPDAETIALWKTISYRPLVSTANLFIDYYWVGAPFATGVLVALQIVVNTTKFYFHEIAWERFFGAAAGKRDAPRVIDFTYAGYIG